MELGNCRGSFLRISPQEFFLEHFPANNERPTRAARHSNRTTRDPCMHSACPRSQCVPNPSYRCTPRNKAAVQGFGVQKGSRIPTPPTGCLCGKPHCPRTGQQEKGQQAKAEGSRLPIGRPSGRYAHRRGVLPLAARKARQKARLLIGRRDARDEAMACFWTFCVG